MVMNERFDLVPVHLAIRAMRDNGYQNTATAIAELIDNSLQAGATTVQLLCREHRDIVSQRERSTIEQIAVLDDGSGMTEKKLREGLQFGNGERLNDRSGIGRFGMGLPNASISQCTRVDVWTWTDGPENALYSYIDLEEVVTGSLVEVPTPVHQVPPTVWSSVAKKLGHSGTLVVWSNLDRCMWRSGTTIINNSGSLIGRMYRQYLNEGRAAIRMVAFDDPKTTRIDRLAVANDPGYLMSGTSTPEPYADKPMFEPDGDRWEEKIQVAYKGDNHEVTLRFSLARSEARNPKDGQDAGSKKYGQHAKRNVGISLMRADRELVLDQSLVNSYDPRERWWGVEVDFPPSLDEVFGVTNNKQTANRFVTVARQSEDLLATKDLTLQQFKEQMQEDGDEAAPLIEIVGAIERRLSDLRARIKVQRANTRKGRKTRFDETSAERVATTATRERQDEGKSGESDAGEHLDRSTRIDEIANELVDEEGLTPEEARDVANDLIDNESKYIFTSYDGEGSGFFTVKSRAGELFIRINMNHPVSANLIELLDEVPDENTEVDELRERLLRSRRGLKLLLMAWARFEDEEHDPASKRRLQDARSDWGSVALKFLEHN